MTLVLQRGSAPCSSLFTFPVLEGWSLVFSQQQLPFLALPSTGVGGGVIESRGKMQLQA